MGVLVKQLSEQLNRIVLDKTGLNGKYDFMLQWTPGKSQDATLQGAEESQEGSDGTPSAESSPSIFTAIQQQLGLKLESQKAPMQVLVIDHVEAPAGN